MTRYPLDRMIEEVAYLAMHLHWSRTDILSLEHPERRRWVLETQRIHDREVAT